MPERTPRRGAGVQVATFGTTSGGEEVRSYRLGAGNGVEAEILGYGATLRGLWLPDRDGSVRNVLLGLPDVAAYEASGAYFGVAVGRYANRIRGGRFELEGATVELSRNEGGNTLHGGARGFDRHVWRAEVPEPDEAAVVLRHQSPAGDQGFPGAVTATVRYALREDALRIAFEATTDATTVVSLTSHPYLQLAGEGAGTVDDHRLTVDADAYLPVDGASLPTGEIQAVDGTPFDLRNGPRLGDAVRADHPQVLGTRGFDHCFVLSGVAASGAAHRGPVRRAARLEHAPSGRWLEVHTDRPGLQVYTGNYLDGSVIGTTGGAYRQGDGVALEAQDFPDAPNHPHFPSTVLRPGERYRAVTELRFGVLEAP